MNLRKIFTYFCAIFLLSITCMQISIAQNNNPPSINIICPKNGSNDVSPIGAKVRLELIDPDNDLMLSEIWSNNTGKWLKYAGWDISEKPWNQLILDYNGDGWNDNDYNEYKNSNGLMGNGIYGFFNHSNPLKDELLVTKYWNMTKSGTTYYWSINVTDGFFWKNQTYKFSTEQMIIYVNKNFNENTEGWGKSHFNKIMDGIQASKEGDIVFVYSGIYDEYVILDKSIKLIGENRNSTHIIGRVRNDPKQLEEYVVLITSENSELSGFTIIGEGFELDGTRKAIDLANGKNLVSNNKITNCIYGIAAINTEHPELYSRSNIIYNNEISNCQISGIYLEKSHDNTVSKNEINEIDCGSQGAAIHLLQSNVNNIVENKIKKCKIGINLEGQRTESNLINHNEINCTQTNILFKNAGFRNIVTTNDFLYPNQKPAWGYIYVENTRDILILGNYYKNYKLNVMFIPMYFSAGKFRWKRLIHYVDMSAQDQPIFQ